MIRTKVKAGEKGQIVIPKIIRENLGIVENREILLEAKKIVSDDKDFDGVGWIKRIVL